jgi:hypothetical protein
VSIPLTAFAFEINETFRYQYNLFVHWEIDCRIESPGLVPVVRPLTCLAARGDPPDEDLDGPAAVSRLPWRAAGRLSRALSSG